MVHREVASYPPEFGTLEVEVVANKWYFTKRLKTDEWSVKIFYSKKEDKSARFIPDVEECFQTFKEKFDLICIIPSSEAGIYSPTLISLAKMLSDKFGVPFDNIILRTAKPEKKMTECKDAKERLEFHRGTLGLSRKLNPDEKTILILDDIKAEGDTKLICAELLINAGAQTVKAICLGINTSDISKSN